MMNLFGGKRNKEMNLFRLAFFTFSWVVQCQCMRLVFSYCLIYFPLVSIKTLVDVAITHKDTMCWEVAFHSQSPVRHRITLSSYFPLHCTLFGIWGHQRRLHFVKENCSCGVHQQCLLLCTAIKNYKQYLENSDPDPGDQKIRRRKWNWIADFVSAIVAGREALLAIVWCH